MAVVNPLPSFVDARGQRVDTRRNRAITLRSGAAGKVKNVFIKTHKKKKKTKWKNKKNAKRL